MHYKVKSSVNTPFYRAMSYIEPSLYPLNKITYGDPVTLNNMLKDIVRSGMTVKEMGQEIENGNEEFNAHKGTAVRGDYTSIHHYGLVFFGALITLIIFYIYAISYNK